MVKPLNQELSKKSRRRDRRGQESRMLTSQGVNVTFSPLNRMHVYSYERRVFSTWVTSTSGEVAYGWAFTLSQVPNASEFTNLYDYYRLKRIDYEMYPGYTASTTDSATSNLLGIVVLAADYDSATASSVDALFQYGNAKTAPLGQPIRGSLYPRTKVGLGSAGGNMLNPAGAWFDVADVDQPYYGLLLAAQQTLTILSYRVVWTYCFDFAGVR